MKKDNVYYNKSGQKLDAPLQLMGMMYELEVNKEKCWFSKLVKLFKDNLTKSDISKAQDKLYDIGLLDMKYEMVDGRWTCCWKLEPEAKSFIRNVTGQE